MSNENVNANKKKIHLRLNISLFVYLMGSVAQSGQGADFQA